MSDVATPAAAPAAGSLWTTQRRPLTSGLVLTTTLIAAEALAVITIMPQVERDLGGLSLYGWVFSAFMLGSLLGTVAAGREADRAGPARPYAVGLVLFAAGLAIGGAAPSMPVLVIGRLLQGVGAGAVPAVAYVAIGEIFEAGARPRMLALLSAAWVVPGLIGPALSAAVAHAFGWRVVFLGLIPLVALAGGLALPALVRLGRPPAERTAEHRLRDAALTAAGAALVLEALAAGNVVLGLVLLSLGAMVGVPALRRLLPAGTLSARRGLPATILSRGLLTFTFFGADAFVTLAITSGLHRSTVLASAVITVSTLAWSAAAWMQARLSASWPERRLIGLGVVLVLVGIGGMVLALRTGVAVAATTLVAWTIAGAGMGLAYAPTSLLMMHQAPGGRTGWASASLNIADVLGTALGAGLGGGALVLASDSRWSLSTGVTIAFCVAAAGALAGLAVARRL
ncbi:MAG TPA: MFS transporter [Solirubrobacteraceae bacterium]|nr:MFS transporter [Solirubrobacteraceae bacterium]